VLQVIQEDFALDLAIIQDQTSLTSPSKLTVSQLVIQYIQWRFQRKLIGIKTNKGKPTATKAAMASSRRRAQRKSDVSRQTMNVIRLVAALTFL
jgi:hypothetical protein